MLACHQYDVAWDGNSSVPGGLRACVIECGNAPASVPAEAASAARDTLGGAVAVAEQLPTGVGDTVLAVAREAFVSGMHFTSWIAAAVAAGLALLAVVALRSSGPAEPVDDSSRSSEQVGVIAPRQLGATD